MQQNKTRKEVCLFAVSIIWLNCEWHGFLFIFYCVEIVLDCLMMVFCKNERRKGSSLDSHFWNERAICKREEQSHKAQCTLTRPSKWKWREMKFCFCDVILCASSSNQHDKAMLANAIAVSRKSSNIILLFVFIFFFVELSFGASSRRIFFILLHRLNYTIQWNAT